MSVTHKTGLVHTGAVIDTQTRQREGELKVGPLERPDEGGTGFDDDDLVAEELSDDEYEESEEIIPESEILKAMEEDLLRRMDMHYEKTDKMPYHMPMPGHRHRYFHGDEKPPKYSSLSKSKQGKLKEQHKELSAEKSFVSLADMKSPYIEKLLDDEVKAGGEKITQRELMKRAEGNDCTWFEKLDPVLRRRVATKRIQQFVEDHKGMTAEQIVSEFKQDPNYVSKMMDPVLRVGISLMINAKEMDEEIREKYRKLDELFNTEIMAATLIKRSAKGTEGELPEEVMHSIRSQKFMARMLLCCHLGKLRKKTTKPGEKPVFENWQGSIANAFCHCSRVMMILPESVAKDRSKKKADEAVAAFRGSAPFYERGGATHNMDRKRKDGTRDAKERKAFTPFNQWGMNVAIGGLYNPGIPGGGGEERPLLNDGTCGHVYMHLERGDEDTYTGVLIGIESDEYKRTNQQGHTHDRHATGEKASSFGGQRVDEIGDKYGGRVADLSGLNAAAFAELMELMDEVFDSVYMTRGEQEETDWDLMELVNPICFDQMNEDQLISYFERLYEQKYRGYIRQMYPRRDAEALFARLMNRPDEMGGGE